MTTKAVNFKPLILGHAKAPKFKSLPPFSLSLSPLSVPVSTLSFLRLLHILLSIDLIVIKRAFCRLFPQIFNSPLNHERPYKFPYH